MKHLSIQTRLTSWYFLSLGIIVALFAAGSWFALRASMYHALDRELGYHISSVVPFVQNRSLSTHEQLAQAFKESPDASIMDVIVQFTDEQSDLVFESDVLASHHVPVMHAGPADGSVAISTVGHHGWPMRVASQRIAVNGTTLTVHVVEPLRDLVGSLRAYSVYLALMIVMALVLVALTGYWMSRRALAPIEQIRKEADAIDPSDLTSRLKVPPTDDELARLARTLNAMLARIEAGFRSIEQFTADASHELRAPLSLIITAGEVSLRRERSREELEGALGKIVRNARHMSKLVENLLALARGDARRQNVELVRMDLAPVLRELCAELAPAAHAKGLELACLGAEDAVWVSGDGDGMRRLFLILLDNAIKYTEAGSIKLSACAEGSSVKVILADTGIGIEPASLPHIFDRFWRADKVRSRAEGGAGLGLSLAAQIAKQHGASIAVQSEVGKGTVFTVQLPAA